MGLLTRNLRRTQSGKIANDHRSQQCVVLCLGEAEHGRNLVSAWALATKQALTAAAPVVQGGEDVII